MTNISEKESLGSMMDVWDVPFEVYKNEEELLHGLQHQERMACTCLLKRFAKQLYRLARRFVKSEADAQDILQESFIQACRHISTFQGKSALGTWLSRIVTNTALMQHRRKSVETLPLIAEKEDGSIDNLSSIVVDERHLPDQQILQAELRLAIQEGIKELPDTLRDAFILRHIEGLSTADAANRLGIEPSALKVRLYRARQELRNMLEPYVRNADLR